MDSATAVFEDIKVALQGTTILPQPRVSRETIISVLQTHTDLIMNMRKDHKALTVKVAEMDMETQMNKKNIKILEVEAQHMKKDVESLYRLSTEFRKEMDELSERVAELYVLKKQVAEQKDYIENLAAQFNKFAMETTTYITDTTKTMNVLQTSCDQTQFQLKEMKDYVDHFADNLILNSQQIMVDSYSGFANRPLSLTEILRMCRSSLDEIQGVDSTQNDQIRRLFADLDTKAPDSVLFNITTLEKKVATIELHIQKEEEQGMGALRKTCEELSVHMQRVRMELEEKIDRESVGFIVHEKYEEIVRYLQDALQSSLEDESNFKQKADEIQEMVILLSNSKADRTEIANMQEIMVKSEALLKKVGAQVNLKDKIKELISRKELEALLAAKVDRAEFEAQLALAVQNSRKNRLQAAVATGLAPVVDEAMMTRDGGGGAGGFDDGLSSSMGNARPGSSTRRSMKSTMLPAVPGYPGAGGGGGSGKGTSTRAAGGGPPGTVSLPLVEQGRLQAPYGTAADASDTDEVPVMAIGQAIGQTVHIPPAPTSSVSPTHIKGTGGGGGGGDFGAFSKGGRGMSKSTKQPGAAGGGGGGASAASRAQGGSPPTLIMSASVPHLGGGNSPFGTGGHLAHSQPQPHVPEGYGPSEFPYGDAPNYRLNYVEQAHLTDHLAYLHGPTVGGGFNAKTAHIVRGMPSASPVPAEDVEGKGLMLQGADGHLYYKDLGPEGGARNQ